MAIPATPREWMDVELPTLISEVGEDAPPFRPVRRADLLAEDAAVLRTSAARMVADRTSRQAAATYLAGWFPGGAGRVVGVALGVAGAGLVLTPEALTWHVVEEGWPAGGSVGDVSVLVPPGHPWSGQAGVETVPEPELLVRTVGALIEFAAPLVEACKSLANVSRSSLWDEVADGVACALSYQPRPLDPAAMDLLSRAVELPGTPWKGRPRLSNVESAVLGPVHVAQKGGCCLAFTCGRLVPPRPNSAAASGPGGTATPGKAASSTARRASSANRRTVTPGRSSGWNWRAPTPDGLA